MRYLLATFGLVALACTKGETSLADSAASATPVASVDAATVTVADLQKLRWIEGRWRGFMPNGEKFYESYRFLDDSTIWKQDYPDSTFGAPSGASHIIVRGGILADTSARSRYVATRLDSTGVDFAPQRGASNSFTWTREDSTKWSATIRWTDAEGRPQNVVYALHRFGR